MEEPARGFTQSDDIVVSVFIPYCEAGAEWEIIINADKPETCPDLVPLPATEAEVGKVGGCGRENRITTASFFSPADDGGGGDAWNFSVGVLFVHAPSSLEPGMGEARRRGSVCRHGLVLQASVAASMPT